MFAVARIGRATSPTQIKVKKMNTKFRDRALAIIKEQNEAKTKSAVIDGISPSVIEAIQGMDSTKKKDDLEVKDYMQLAREHKLNHGGSLIDAMKWVEKNYPHKRREYLRKHNPHIDI
jgi:hypothetical protein